MLAVARVAPVATPRRAASSAQQCRLGCSGGAARAAAAAAPLVQPWGGLHGLQAQARPGRLARAQAGAADGPGSSGDNGGSGDHSGESDSLQQCRPRGRPASPLPNVDAEQLLQSLGLSGAASAPALLGNICKLNGERQNGVLQHAAAVVQHLCGPSVGLTHRQAGQLLEGCPELFSWEPEQRAAPLFVELIAAGLPAGEAAQCVLTCPQAAAVRSLAAGLSELAAILAHSQDRQGGRGPKHKLPAAQRTVAALLRRSPSAVRLACQADGWLLQRSEQLQQAGLSAAQVAALAWWRPDFFTTDAAPRLLQAVAVLQEQLGLAAADVVDLVARRKPSWLGSSADTLRARAAALAEGFGRTQSATIVTTAAQALQCPPEVWRRNLYCMAACGVADPKAVLGATPLLLHVNHAAPDFVQRRLLLQRCFDLTAAQLYEEQPGFLTQISVQRLVQRLQFIEHCGQQHRLAAKVPRGGAATCLLPHERPLGLTVVCQGKQPDFLAAMGASEAEWEAFQQQHPPGQCALYRWVQQAAEPEVERLRAALPAELRQVQRRRFKGK